MKLGVLLLTGLMLAGCTTPQSSVSPTDSEGSNQDPCEEPGYEAPRPFRAEDFANASLNETRGPPDHVVFDDLNATDKTRMFSQVAALVETFYPYKPERFEITYWPMLDREQRHTNDWGIELHTGYDGAAGSDSYEFHADRANPNPQTIANTPPTTVSEPASDRLEVRLSGPQDSLRGFPESLVGPARVRVEDRALLEYFRFGGAGWDPAEPRCLFLGYVPIAETIAAAGNCNLSRSFRVDAFLGQFHEELPAPDWAAATYPDCGRPA